MAKKVSEGDTAEPTVTDQADDATVSTDAGAGPSVSGAPQLENAAGTTSTDNPESEGKGGTGDLAGSTDDLLVDRLIAAGGVASAEQLGEIDDYLKVEQDKFRAAYPKLSAAIDAWQAQGGPAPTAVRIVSKIDGFRRAGIAHSKDPREHPVESFRLPEHLEALLAEPNLIVEFV